MSWDPNEYPEESVSNGASSVLNALEEEHQQVLEHEQQVVETLSEAMKRIEEANLWKTLLNQDVFQSGSARSEIVNSINNKIKKFALNNLELCVGIRSEVQSKPEPKEVKLPFDQEEMTALKILAAKVLKRDISQSLVQQTYNPQLSPVVGPNQTNKINSIAVDTKPVPQQNAKVQTKKVIPAKQKPKMAPNYIPPASNYIPPSQTSAIGAAGNAGMQNLISNLIQQASGGNVLATNDSSANDGNIGNMF